MPRNCISANDMLPDAGWETAVVTKRGCSGEAGLVNGNLLLLRTNSLNTTRAIAPSNVSTLRGTLRVEGDGGSGLKST